MQDEICLRCQSTEVFRGQSADGEGLSAGSFNAVVELIVGHDTLTARIDTFICLRCGHVELRISDRQTLVRVAQADGWDRAASHSTPPSL